MMANSDTKPRVSLKPPVKRIDSILIKNPINRCNGSGAEGAVQRSQLKKLKISFTRILVEFYFCTPTPARGQKL